MASSDVQVEYKGNPLAKKQVRENALQGIIDVFTLDIWPAAVQESPVLTGTNRRSVSVDIAVDGRDVAGMAGEGFQPGQTQATEAGIVATVYTQSGYGGYLETGTVKMPARPYIWPAFNRFKDRIYELIRRRNEESGRQ